eukprot:gene7289-8066_t
MDGSFHALLQTFVIPTDENEVALHGKTYKAINEALLSINQLADQLGWEHPQCVSLINDVVDLYNDAHLFHYAEQLSMRLKTAFERTYPPHHRIHGQISIKLANALLSELSFARAETSYREALALYKRIGVSRTDLELASALSGLSKSLVAQHQLDEAETVLKHLLEVYLTNYGNGHKDSLATINRLSQVLEQNNKATEAVTICQESLDLCVRTLGETDAITQEAAVTLARLKQAIGQPHEAEQIFRKALRYTTAGLGPLHLQTLHLEKVLASLLVKIDKFEEADEIFRRVLHCFEEQYGKISPECFEVCECLGDLYMQLNDPEVAREFFTKAYDGRCAFYSKNHPTSLFALFLQAQSYDLESSWRHRLTYEVTLQSAHRLLKESYAGLVKVAGRQSPVTIRVARYFATFLVAHEFFEEAEAIFDHLFETVVRPAVAARAQDINTITIIMDRAYIKEKRKLFVLANDLYEQALSLVKELRKKQYKVDEEQSKRQIDILQQLEQAEGDCIDHLNYVQRMVKL